MPGGQKEYVTFFYKQLETCGGVSTVVPQEIGPGPTVGTQILRCSSPLCAGRPENSCHLLDGTVYFIAVI